jgi:biopolymer transport protein ExbB
MNVLTSIATFYKQGGIFMHAVLVIAVLIVAIVFERFIVIGRATALNGRKLTNDLVKSLQRGDVQKARAISQKSSAPVAQVAQSMLEAGTSDEAALQSAADDAATLALPELTRRLSYLGVLANSATLIGLLGTITGLITAISGVGVADAAQRSAYLAAGISEALHTTAFGLVIAIPTLMIQGWLNGRVESVAQEVDEMSIRLSRALAGTDEARVSGPVATFAGRVADELQRAAADR